MKNFFCMAGMVILSACTVVPPAYVSIDRQKENPYYVAPAVNSPLLFEKGDVIFNPAFSFSDQRYGGDFMFAIKPFDNVGFMANISNHGYGHNNSNYGSEGKDLSYINARVEIASGYSKKLNDLWLVETFAGVGYASIENDHATGNSTINQTLLFLQPAVGFRNAARKTELGFALRLQAVNFNIDYVYFEQGVENHTALQFKQMQDHPWQFMLEPGAFVRFGSKNFKVNLGVNYSQNLSFSEMDAKKFTATVGTRFGFNWNEKRKRKQQRQKLVQ